METFGTYVRRSVRTPLLILGGLLALGILLLSISRHTYFAAMEVLGVLPYLVVALFGYLFYLKIQYRRLFWTEYAKYRGWTYLPAGQAEAEDAMMFRQGNNRSVTDVVTGTILEHPLKLCNYNFRIGQGKNSQIYSYTVIIVKFIGKFPHVYVDRLDHGYGLNVGRALPLPTEVAKQYKIFSPPEYEIEALAIFDPETLVKLLDLKFNYDMELINQKLYIFLPQMIDSISALEQRLQQAEALLASMIPHLDHTNYQPIPHSPDTL
jgi:hypothetical protein